MVMVMVMVTYHGDCDADGDGGMVMGDGDYHQRSRLWRARIVPRRTPVEVCMRCVLWLRYVRARMCPCGVCVRARVRGQPPLRTCACVCMCTFSAALCVRRLIDP
jgi:hypothetical protein